jgi:hypothetical protein
MHYAGSALARMEKQEMMRIVVLSGGGVCVCLLLVVVFSKLYTSMDMISAARRPAIISRQSS